MDANGKKIDTDGSYEDYKDQLVVDTEAITWKRKQGLFKVNDDNKLVDAEGNVIATENNRLVNESDIEKLVRDDIEGIRIKDPDGNYVMVDDYEQDYVKDDDGKAVLDEDAKEFLADIESGKSTPLKNITSDYHYHTVTADSEETLGMIEEELRKLGFLVEN